MRTFTISNYERQIALGTILGTSCIRKHPRGRNYSLYMRATDDYEWFQVKCGHLEQFARNPDPNRTWESVSHSIWNEFRDLAYKDGKKTASMDWLNMLNSVGLSTWFVDKGGLCGNRAYIRVANLENQDVVKQWFCEVGYPCELRKQMAVFSQEVTERLCRSVSASFPKCLLQRPNPYRTRKYL